MREGFGVMVYSRDQTYEGEWVRNKRQGWGRMSYSDGSYYEVIQTRPEVVNRCDIELIFGL